MAVKQCNTQEQQAYIRAVHDTMYVLSGKWKISIIAVLCYNNEQRFSDILNHVSGISNKMLSKELKDLESNKIIKRTVEDTQPITVHYQLTKYGEKLKTVIGNLADWGMEHRRFIMSKQ